jgi:hypothetical protein
MQVNDEELLIFKHQLDQVRTFINKRAGSAIEPCDIELKIIELQKKFEDILAEESRKS